MFNRDKCFSKIDNKNANMSKVPKKPPTWIPVFADFVKKAESDQTSGRNVDNFSALIVKHWETFHSYCEAKRDEKPKKKKREPDPMKSLESAMGKVAGEVHKVKDNKESMNQYQERMKEIVPDELKTILHKAVANPDEQQPQRSGPDVSRLMQKTSRGLSTLKQVTQKVLTYANVNQNPTLQQDAEMAVKSLDEVTENIGELRDVLK